MKIIFVENRYKTILFEKIATELKNDGITSVFLVQNKIFAPKYHSNYFIPYPEKKDYMPMSDKLAAFNLKEKDRGYKYFGSGSEHYNYYYENILSFLKREKAICVFGESTLFHELLTIEACKELGIMYLHPTSCRYPAGRFSFYQYDTLIPFNENVDFKVEPSDIELANSISRREVVPDYMAQKPSKIQTYWNKMHSIVSLTMSYYLGEKYNTPSPLKKIKLNYSLKNIRKNWEQVSTDNLAIIDDWKKVLVYPLQMQPEANLDVWGFPYNDQVENIRKLLIELPKDWQLIVKPNPKSKFELTNDLLTLANSNQIIAVSHKIDMSNIFQNAQYFFAVTGTVCFECIFAQKTGFSPALPQVKMFANEQYGFPSQRQLGVKSSSKQNPAALISYLRNNSYQGVITDHFHSSTSYSYQNILNIKTAFNSVIYSLSNPLKAAL